MRRSLPVPKPLPDPAPDYPRLLPIRLARSTPSLTFTFIIGAILTGVAALAWFAGHNYRHQENGWLLPVFCGVFAFFGLLVLWSWFSQLLMSRTPITLVEISSQPFYAGETFRIALIQRGPAKIKSLRANLVCLEQHITWKERSDSDGGTESYRHVKEKMIHTQNLVDASFILAPTGSDWHTIQEFTVPADARPSLDTNTHCILWKIELWGKGPLLGNFMHPFEVQVSGPKPASPFAPRA